MNTRTYISVMKQPEKKQNKLRQKQVSCKLWIWTISWNRDGSHWKLCAPFSYSFSFSFATCLYLSVSSHTLLGHISLGKLDLISCLMFLRTLKGCSSAELSIVPRTKHPFKHNHIFKRQICSKATFDTDLGSMLLELSGWSLCRPLVLAVAPPVYTQSFKLKKNAALCEILIKQGCFSTSKRLVCRSSDSELTHT